MNNIIKILLVTFSISFPSTVFGGIGDVYYCSMKNFVGIQNSEVIEYKLEKFKFKITNSGLKFGSEEGFFSDLLIETPYPGNIENFFKYTSSDGSTVNYHNGTFTFSYSNNKLVYGIYGTCEKF